MKIRPRVFLTMAKSATCILVPEMNLRQIFYETERVVHGRVPVFPVNKIGGGEMITPEELLTQMKKRMQSLD